MSSTKRQERVAEEIKKAVGLIIYRELEVPELKMITISQVKISPDIGYATLYYTILNNSEEQQAKIEKLCKIHTRRVRQLLSKKLRLRVVPHLTFAYDDTLDNVYKLEGLFNKIKKDDQEEE